MRISDWSSDVCSSDLPIGFNWPGSGKGSGMATTCTARFGSGAGVASTSRGASWTVARGFADVVVQAPSADAERSEEHTSELQSLMRISYAVFCLKKKKDK